MTEYQQIPAPPAPPPTTNIRGDRIIPSKPPTPSIPNVKK